VFLNIRYATAKRLEAPKLATSWTQEEPFTNYVQCHQFISSIIIKRDHAIETEDCLRMHIYTPITSLTSPGTLPVYFWIHGGAYKMGKGGWPYEGFPFVKRNAIFVSINYRLGPLGFYGGNWGFLDGLTALEWVQAHISSFGRDPNRVLTFGQSAGGGAVNWLMTSRDGRTGKLFKALFSQSPTWLYVCCLCAVYQFKYR